MQFIYGRQDMQDLVQAQTHCWLQTNGLGGYASLSAAFSVSRCDQGLLISSFAAPTVRNTLVHRISEEIIFEDKKMYLSSQEFADGTPNEDGFCRLTSFVWNAEPKWHYEAQGISVERSCSMGFGENATAVFYRITNHTQKIARLQVSPRFLCSSKGHSHRRTAKVHWDGKKAICGGVPVFVNTDANMISTPVSWEKLYYRDDAVDGRHCSGNAFYCCKAVCDVGPNETAEMTLVFSDRPITKTAEEIRETMRVHRASLPNPFRTMEAQILTHSADAFISHRDSTNGETIIAGYPFFGDWGRDTMIALQGCVLETERYETAKSILRTFFSYEKDGLVPNLFPEGGEAPRYNTVDAALLLINSVYLYHQKTGDIAFVQEVFPVMQRIIDAYTKGTHHGICMDDDGLIRAGEGLDQVTWMDVCVDGILPTPRHGKPVEINAYWYNALMIMAYYSKLFEMDGSSYLKIASRTKQSFLDAFWCDELGCLKDVISGTSADVQLRCNQIWAVTMPFGMLSREQERQVVNRIYEELYTPCGLRTLSPNDPEFHPTYGGSMRQRDLAYHQGTVWVYPLGAWYRAYLKINDYSIEAAAEVRCMLNSMEPMLREGCIGQLPEIYDGLYPSASRGCFAQAWSVGELLTVYRLLESIEDGSFSQK